MHESSKSTVLSANQRSLVNLIKSIKLGCIKDLIVLDGEPLFNPAPRIVYSHNFVAVDDPAPPIKSTSKIDPQMLKFIDHLKNIKVGMVQIKIEKSLPTLMHYEKHIPEKSHDAKN